MELSSIKPFQEIRNNPLEFCKLLSKYAEIQLVKNIVIKGFISSVDPITYSIILLVHQDKQNGSYQKVLIPGHAVHDITLVQSEMRTPISLSVTTTCSDHKEKKEKLIEWFRLNLLTVTECDDNILFGNVTILPPYNVEDICTDNPIIAMQVKKVMEKMPEDFGSQTKNVEKS